MQEQGVWTVVRLEKLKDEHSDVFIKRLWEDCLGQKLTDWRIWKESMGFSRKSSEKAQRMHVV